MKKLLTIITLFVSSFFFLSLEDVKALTFNDYSLVNSDTFLNIKSKADELKESISFDNYLISYINSQSTYYVQFFNETELLLTGVYSSGYIYGFKFSKMENYIYNSSTSTLTSYASFSTSVTLSVSKYSPLYSNTNILFKYSDASGSYGYKTPDFSKTYSSSSDDGIFPLLYNICVDSGNCSSPENKVHKEELEKVESFYKVIIEKISYLADEISNNYIYLSIIVIFLLILVFEMIFRRYL